MVCGAVAGAGVPGSSQLQSDNGFPLAEAVALVAGSQRILSLVGSAKLTTTQMPTNTGDRVVYIASAATVPSANPVSGGIIYGFGGAIFCRGSGGTIMKVA